MNDALVNKINEIFFDELKASPVNEQLIEELRNKINECSDIESLQAIIEKYLE